ncbi:hypothetical protein H2199_006721 [Coniosporium tulheliwenetii]|uniref:Uncharacterized protein n=1 Tax=Coniosporium tulheliwenetii TaxID=3383036 RepID=A0ACC2YUU8_9PEZI|nr:hypothetical protein H2199_006721 [Cladosporium sp. JES 115]
MFDDEDDSLSAAKWEAFINGPRFPVARSVIVAEAHQNTSFEELRLLEYSLGKKYGSEGSTDDTLLANTRNAELEAHGHDMVSQSSAQVEEVVSTCARRPFKSHLYKQLEFKKFSFMPPRHGLRWPRKACRQMSGESTLCSVFAELKVQEVPRPDVSGTVQHPRQENEGNDDDITSQHGSSCLLELPTELRLQILEEVLRPRSGVINVAKSGLVLPSILRTCNQLYHEGLPIYSKNKFYFPSELKPNDLLNTICPLPGPRPLFRRLQMKHLKTSAQLVQYKTRNHLAYSAFNTHSDARMFFCHRPFRNRRLVATECIKFLAFMFGPSQNRPDELMFYLQRDMSAVFKPLKYAGPELVETLTLAVDGLEGWLLNSDWTSDDDRELPIAVLFAAIVTAQPPTERLIIKGLGKSKKAVERFWRKLHENSQLNDKLNGLDAASET